MFFTTFIAQPIFNLLVLIYALLPGHNFGLSIIIFTVIIRLLLWPLVRRQLHQTKMMRKLQPQLKSIKLETKGDRQKEALLVSNLYKQHGVNPFGSIAIVLLQLPILIALYNGLQRVVGNPEQLVKFAYPSLRHLPWMEQLAHNVHLFDGTLFGFLDLTKSATGPAGIYIPAMVVVLASSVVQYFQGKQLMVTDKNARSLRTIMKEAGEGKEADQAEMSAAIGRYSVMIIPVMVFLFTIKLPAALGLYWLVGGLIAYGQQSLILREDVTELEALADAPIKRIERIPEAEVLAAPVPAPKKIEISKTKLPRNKRRKRK